MKKRSKSIREKKQGYRKWHVRAIAYVLSVFVIINLMPMSVYAQDFKSEQVKIDEGMNTAIAPAELESEIYEVSSGDALVEGISTFSMRNVNEKTEVLLIKNKNPWNSTANEVVLGNLGISYKTVTVENAVELNFEEYKLIIVANDQEDSFYRTLSSIRTKLELFVMDGGTLLYGICDAGWGNGYSDLLIPGDIELEPVSYQHYNYIVDKEHPIVSGVLTNEEALTNNKLYNTYASHRYFKVDSLPTDASIILNAGEDMPTLVEYSIGNGIVVASALTWEHSYDHSSTNFGREKFDDLILYAYMVACAVTEINKNPNLGFEEYVNGLTCTAGDPVNVANGNFITGSIDMSYEGDVSINFSRYYNSLDSYQGILGKNWRSNYNVYLQQLSERRLRLWHEDGHSEDFIFGDDEIWYATPGTYSVIDVNENGIEITLKDKTIYKFDSNYRLLSIKQPYSKEITFEYNEMAQVTLIEQGDFWFKYSYENEYLTEVNDKSGRSVKFQYADGNLISVENYDGKITRYEYDDAGRMTKMHVDEEYTVHNTYDDFGRVIGQEMSQEGSCQFIYDDESLTTTYIDKNGASTIYHKDDQGRIYKKEYVDGSEFLEFDSNNKLVKETDKRGNSTYYEYDINGNCISETDAIGNKTSYEFDERGNRTAMIDAEGNRYEYTYDVDNYLISQSDAYGQFTHFIYDEKKQLIKILLPNGKEMFFSYDDYGNIISTTDADGNQTVYAYNDMNQIVKEIDANGNVIMYEYSDFGRTQKKIFEDGSFSVSKYDENDNLVEYIDELGNQEFYVFNSVGLLTTFKDRDGNIISYEYDCMNNVSKIINADGSERIYIYDACDNLIQIIDEEGYSTHYTYDANGNIIEETDGNGNVTRYTYDALNRIISITDARGNVTTNEYSPNGNLLTVTDANGNSQKYEYNSNGQVTRWINEAGEEECYVYDVMGNVTAAVDSNGNIVRYEYNAFGDITKIIYPDESFVSIGYDGIGNMISYIEPNGTETKYAYSDKGFLVSEIFVNGATREYSYDAVGNQISSKDENGNTTIYEYDQLNRMTKVIDAMGNATEYEYDVHSNITEISQYAHVQDAVIKTMKSGKGTAYDSSITELITRYEYDKKNQLVKEIGPTGQEIIYQYDANGNMICKTDEDAVVTRYEYDAVNNLVGIKYGVEKSVSYQYNAINYVVGMTDWNGSTKYELDALGRILNVVDYQGRQIEYQWNANDKKSLIVYPDNTTVSYEYNSKNQLTKVNDSVQGITTYEYDINGNVVKVSAPNGTMTTNTYDSMSRLIQKIDYDKNNNIVDDYTYSYDAVGNKISINRDKKLSYLEKMADESNGITCYEYDALNRLVSQTNSKNVKEKYFYDSLGNRIRKEIWTKSGKFLSVCDYDYNVENQLESVQGNSESVYGTIATKPVTMEYDGRGNLIKVSQNQTELASYVYDDTNAMVQSVNLMGLVTNYLYDGNGARISKTTSLPDNFEKLPSTIQKQLNSSLTALCDEALTGIEKEVANYYINDITSDYNSVLMTYGNYSKGVRFTYGIDVLGAASWGSGEIDWNNGTEKTVNYDSRYNVYYFLDEQNTPIKLTNQAGKVVQKYSYNEYGTPGIGTYISSFIGKNSVIGYAGYQYDNETGLYFLQARYYDPNTAVFVSRDAFDGMLADVQSLNGYVYCFGNPIAYIDPSGYVTTSEGIVVHQMLQAYFLAFYSTKPNVTAHVEYKVNCLTKNISNTGRADMVLDRKYIMEVYEIKPYRYRYMSTGRAQLQEYIKALNMYGETAIKGYSFLPFANMLTLPYPLDTTRSVRFYTYPDDPGMIYYGFVKNKKQPSNEPSTSPATEPSKAPIKIDTEDVCEGVLVAGGTVAVGYVIYRVVRLIPSCTPWTWWSLPANLATP